MAEQRDGWWNAHGNAVIAALAGVAGTILGALVSVFLLREQVDATRESELRADRLAAIGTLIVSADEYLAALDAFEPSSADGAIVMETSRLEFRRAVASVTIISGPKVLEAATTADQEFREYRLTVRSGGESQGLRDDVTDSLEALLDAARDEVQ